MGLVRRFVTLVVVLLLLLLVADRVAAYLTAIELESRVQRSEHLAHKPHVVVHGFPFLTQVIGGRYDRIDATVLDLPVPQGTAAGGLQVSELHVTLRGVHVNLRDLLHGDVRRVPVDRGDATARVSYAQLDAALNQQVPGGLFTVHTSDGGSGQVALAGTYSGVGGPVSVRGVAGVTIADGRVRVTPVPSTLAALPSIVRDRVISALTASFGLPALPFDVHLQDAHATKDGVVLAATGEHLVLVRP
ncbi:MAG TPA: DUF2993 domain-containing protein [Mycobacteriales bacterium]|nr:DUF2993 domain-containing protein [Mycobacteriales bacterium]